jgi:hypothetical protein
MVYLMRKFFLTTVALIFLAGCVGPKIEKLAVCPGRASLEDSLAALNNQAGQIKPFRASGQCFATVYENEKRHKEEFTVKLWFNPPNELRLFGDVAFNARGLDIGSNETEFWLAARPKELGNSFSWGKWSEQKGSSGFVPKMLLESLGKITIGNPQDWSLSNQGTFDILTEQSQGKIVKKIYIYCCDYRIRKIEYFNDEGKVSVVLEMKNYREIFDGGLFPMELRRTDFRKDGKEALIRVVFETVKDYDYSSQKRAVFFERPMDLNGFEHIYKSVDGGLIEQKK